MISKVRNVALIAGLVAALSSSAFAAQKSGGAKHVAVGTITSIDGNQVVVNEKVISFVPKKSARMLVTAAVTLFAPEV